MPPRGKPRGGNFYLVSSNIIRTFALSFQVKWQTYKRDV